MDIKPLIWAQDRVLVARFFTEASDYVTLETGKPPNTQTVDEFFHERPPNIGPDDAVHFGLFDAHDLRGIAAMTFGFPNPRDAYIGLLLLSPTARGAGNGVRVLDHLTALAQARGARHQLVAVLDANTKGRAFWDREGFAHQKTFAPSDDDHIRHRLIRDI